MPRPAKFISQVRSNEIHKRARDRNSRDSSSPGILRVRARCRWKKIPFGLRESGWFRHFPSIHLTTLRLLWPNSRIFTALRGLKIARKDKSFLRGRRNFFRALLPNDVQTFTHLAALNLLSLVCTTPHSRRQINKPIYPTSHRRKAQCEGSTLTLIETPTDYSLDFAQCLDDYLGDDVMCDAIKTQSFSSFSSF